VTLRVIQPLYTHPPARGRRERARAAGVDSQARWTPFPPKDAAERVYIVGGAAPSGAPPLGATEFVFDPSSWRLTPIAPLPFARRYAAAVALPDGRILVIGGQRVSDGAPTASVMSYSPSSDAWR